MPQKPLTWSDDDTPPQSAASNRFAWSDEKEATPGAAARPDFSKNPPPLPKSHIKVEPVATPQRVAEQALELPARISDRILGDEYSGPDEDTSPPLTLAPAKSSLGLRDIARMGINAVTGTPGAVSTRELSGEQPTGDKTVQGLQEVATPGKRLRGVNRLTSAALDVASPVIGPEIGENPIGLAKVLSGAKAGQVGAQEGASSLGADPDETEFAGNVGGLVGGGVAGGLRGPRTPEAPPVEAPAAEEPLPDATPPPQPVRGLLRPKPTELPPSTAVDEPEGLLDANRRVVRDPATGRMKVQYLTSSGGKVVREAPVAPAEGIPESPPAEPGIPEGPKVPKGGIRGVQPPTGYTVDTPEPESDTETLMRGGNPQGDPFAEEVAQQQAKDAAGKKAAKAQPPTGYTPNPLEPEPDTETLMRGANPEVDPRQVEVQQDMANNAAAKKAPRNGRGIQVPLDEWQAGQEIPTQVENTKIPRQTLLNTPNGAQPLAPNADLTDPLQKSVEQLNGGEGEQRPPFADPASSTSYGSRNQGVTAEQAAQAKKDLADKMFRSNTGFDPTMLADAAKIGLFHLEAGAREFGAWSQKMLDELGEGVKPYLEQLWKQTMQPAIPGLENMIDIEPADAPMFYSKAAKIVQEKIGGKGSGEQILATLRNSGVKEDEIKWMGLDDFLKSKPKVTKAEVQQFIRENQIRLEETNLKTADTELQDKFDQATHNMNQAYGALLNELRQWHTNGVAELMASELRNGIRGSYEIEPREARYAAREFMQAQSDWQQARDLVNEAAQSNGKAKYEQYSLPGPKGDYTEMLMQMPNPGAAEAQAAFDEFAQRMQNKYAAGGQWAQKISPEEELTRQYLSEAVRTTRDGGFNSSHFNSPNIIAHVRFDERVGQDGKPMLFLEEVQSDWHQRGKQQGYAPRVSAQPQIPEQITRPFQYVNGATAWEIVPATPPDGYSARFVDPVRIVKYEGSGWQSRGMPFPEGQQSGFRVTHNSLADVFPTFEQAEQWGRAQQRNQMVQLAREYGSGSRSGKVPDAPFKTDWHELALKRMLRYAAENGYDRIGWTTGEQQAQRYDLTKHIDRITYDPEAARFTAYDHGGSEVLEKENVSWKDVEELVGKGLSDELQKHDHIKYDEDWTPDEEPDEEGDWPEGAWDAQPYTHELEGTDLKIGGEWAHNLYDKAIPNFLNKYGKKWGAKVEEGTVPSSLGDDERYSVHERDDGGVDVIDRHGEPVGEFDSREQAEKLMRREGFLDHTVHTMPITPEMKKSVLKEGQPISENRAAPLPQHEIPELAIPA
jgi:hypothetical protein